MYASLIGAGVSQLYDLFRSQTPSSAASTPSSGTTPPSPAPASASASTTTGTGRVGALSSDLNTLFLDLQSGGATATSSSAADPTTTVANDLQSVFGDLSKARGAHGHHHHHADADAQSASSGSANTGATNPFQSLSASLLAYTKGQGLTASQSASTSLTA